MPEPVVPIYVRVSDAPTWFSISRDRIYKAQRAGEIEIYKKGPIALVKTAEIMAWIEGDEAESAPSEMGTIMGTR